MPWQFHIMAILVGWFGLMHFIDMIHWIKPSETLLEMMPHTPKQRLRIILLKIPQWGLSFYLVAWFYLTSFS